MDDRRFDALVKAVAAGSSRRSMLKGLLGLGGAVVAGGTLVEPGAQAARRPTPTPKPPTCPGKQLPCATGCCCPLGFEKCGPDCCTAGSIPAPQPGHSECCDQACCIGTCYGEELCCPTNNRSSGELPIPPTHKICESIDNGKQCCEFEQPCCSFDGCCDTVCWGDGAFCCPNDPASFCRGGETVEDICCVNVENDVFACCNGGTDARVCYDTSVEGACCTDADCGDPCQICNPETNICQPRCDAATQVCCTEQAGPGVCVTGECCLGVPSCAADEICCQGSEGTVCGVGDTCAPIGCDLCAVQGLDCCIINDAFAGCYDASADGACCTAAQCEYFNEFDDCLVGACTGFECEQIGCTSDQHCCDGTCSDLECEPSPQQCSNDEDCGGDIVCCVGTCCTAGQSCVTDPDNNSQCE